MRQGLEAPSAALVGSVLLAAASLGALELEEAYWRQGLGGLAVRHVAATLATALPLALLGALLARGLGAVARLRRLAPAAVPLALAAALLVDARILPGMGPLGRLGTLAAIALVCVGLEVRAHRGSAMPSGSRGSIAAGALALLAIAAAFAGAAWAVRIAPADHPNLLLIVLDTVRADRLSAFGYARPTTPNLERLARDAVRFSDFHATSSWTLPSHASLFTGLYPARHQATQELPILGRRHVTLAEVLANAGYATYAAVANPWAGPRVQLDQGFERLEDLWKDGHGWTARDPRAPHPVSQALLRLLEEHPRGRPFFAFANYLDAHGPYTPAEPFRSRFLRAPLSAGRQRELLERASWARHYTGTPLDRDELAILSDLYDAEIAQLDAELGSLLDRLREAGRFDDTWIVVTSDHGEHFGENHRVFHSFTLYRTAVRVPLLIRPPGGLPGGRTDVRPAQLVDLAPTLLRAAALQSDLLSHQGHDLFAAPPAGRGVLAEYYRPQQEFRVLTPAARQAHAATLAPLDRRLRSFEEGAMRLIWASDGRHELYDLARDPGETRNLFGIEAHRATAERLQAALAARLDALREHGAVSDAPVSAPEPDAETADALRALGYAP